MVDARTLILRHHDEVWSRGDLDAIDALYAPDFVGHHPGLPDWVGREGVKLAVRTIRAAFPDFHESVEDVIVEGDRVVTRSRPRAPISVHWVESTPLAGG